MDLFDGEFLYLAMVNDGQFYQFVDWRMDLQNWGIEDVGISYQAFYFWW